MNYGIKETKEFLRFVIDMAQAIDKSLEDGELSVFDSANFVTAIVNAGAAFDNIDLVPKEIADLSQEEANELYTYVTTELKLSNTNVEVVVQRSLEIGLKIYELVLFLKTK